MLKLFLTASATSAISFALLYSFKQTRQNVLTSINNMGSLMNRGYLPFIVGGLLLGAGLDLAGTCPGMVFVEVFAKYSSDIDWSVGAELLVYLAWVLCWYFFIHAASALYASLFFSD